MGVVSVCVCECPRVIDVKCCLCGGCSEHFELNSRFSCIFFR